MFLGANLDDAHDLAQVVLIKCYTSWPKVCKANNRDSYVYQILLNCYRDSRRRRWWAERPSSDLPDLPDAADHARSIETTDSIHRAMKDLSKVNREVVVLRYLAQLSEQQTADILNIAAGTVKSRLSRAISQLANSPHLTGLAGRY